MQLSSFRMWSSSVLLLSLVAVCCGLDLGLGSRPRYIGCQTSDECGKDSCCVIGMGRYSIPTCQPRRDVGETCRPLVEPVNTTLHYPDGVSVELAEVYYIVCPCHGGLSCTDEMTCVDNSALGNHIDHDYDYGEVKLI